MLEALDRFAANPRADQLVKLTGRDESRLRVGDWRVILRLDHDELLIVVVRIQPRGRAYRD